MTEPNTSSNQQKPHPTKIKDYLIAEPPDKSDFDVYHLFKKHDFGWVEFDRISCIFNDQVQILELCSKGLVRCLWWDWVKILSCCYINQDSKISPIFKHPLPWKYIGSSIYLYELKNSHWIVESVTPDTRTLKRKYGTIWFLG